MVRKALIWLLGLILVRKALFSLESIGVRVVKFSFFQILDGWATLIAPKGGGGYLGAIRPLEAL